MLYLDMNVSKFASLGIARVQISYLCQTCSSAYLRSEQIQTIGKFLPRSSQIDQQPECTGRPPLAPPAHPFRRVCSTKHQTQALKAPAPEPRDPAEDGMVLAPLLILGHLTRSSVLAVGLRDLGKIEHLVAVALQCCYNASLHYLAVKQAVHQGPWNSDCCIAAVMQSVSTSLTCLLN